MTTLINNRVILRPAVLQDVPLLEHWDTLPHVIAATSDDPDAKKAFDSICWQDEIIANDKHTHFLIAQLDGRAIGAMQIIDPLLESTHYWGEVEPNLRALDIWIGESDCLGKGYGETMMRRAFLMCFEPPEVRAIIIDPLSSNVRAHKFYKRLGFEPVGHRMFDDDDCLIHRLERETWQIRFGGDLLAHKDRC